MKIYFDIKILIDNDGTVLPYFVDDFKHEKNLKVFDDLKESRDFSFIAPM